jgi:hypothetical protein
VAQTYPQYLDQFCAERGYTWRVWEEWRQMSGFERRLYWHGEVVGTDGEPIATVRDYRPGKVWNGESGAARQLWRALGLEED